MSAPPGVREEVCHEERERACSSCSSAMLELCGLKVLVCVRPTRFSDASKSTMWPRLPDQLSAR